MLLGEKRGEISSRGGGCALPVVFYPFVMQEQNQMCMKVLQTLVWDGKEAGTIGTGTSVDPGEALINKTKIQPACSALSLPPAGNLG